MDLIGESIEHPDPYEQEDGLPGIVKIAVPGVGGGDQGQSEEKIGGKMKKEVVEGDGPQRKLYFLQGRHVEYCPRGDEGG